MSTTFLLYFLPKYLIEVSSFYLRTLIRGGDCLWCGFYHVWNSFNLIFAICFLVKSWNLKYSWFWHLTLDDFVEHYIDFWSKFLLGTKIAHVWEEKESKIISIRKDSVSITWGYKLSHSVTHTVETKNFNTKNTY